jgi:2-amino-4-hydroxy-6-hydroxymethyldihydropteridine diphosphokinase
MSSVILGLGSNQGDRLAYLRGALQALAALPDTQITAVSALYESAPWGVTDQPAFLNAAAAIASGLAPHALLHAVKAIERAAGREAGPRWGPRPLDIDLLLYDDSRVETPDLVIPHPRLTARRFVLAPLQDLRPAWRDAAGRDLPALLAAVVGQPVAQVATGAWWDETTAQADPAPRAG